MKNMVIACWFAQDVKLHQNNQSYTWTYQNIYGIQHFYRIKDKRIMLDKNVTQKSFLSLFYELYMHVLNVKPVSYWYQVWFELWNLFYVALI